MPITITRQEAEVIARAAVNSSGGNFDSFDPMLQTQAILGIISTVNTMQQLGWRIARPLIDVSIEEQSK